MANDAGPTTVRRRRPSPDFGRDHPVGPAAGPDARAPALALVALLAPAVALFAVTAAPAPVEAQASPIHVEFGVQGGVLSPRGTLAERGASEGGDLALTESFAFGGHAGVQLLGGLTLEGALATSPGTEVANDDGTVTGASFLSATGHLVFRLPLPLVEPFFGAGGGVRRLAFDDPSTFGEESVSDVAGTLLAGAYVTALPGWRIRVEARDVITGFEDPETGDSSYQNDLLFLAGLSWQVP